MNPERLITIARFTRPFMRYRTPVFHPLCKWVLKRICPRGQKGYQLVADYEGGRIHIDTATSIEYSILFRGCHEPVIMDLIGRYVRRGDSCLDVGANIGVHALLMARAAGAEGRVIALEPHPVMAERLRRNVELNRYRQITIVEAALSDRDGTATFYGFGKDAYHKGISSLLPDEEAVEELRVPTVCGDTLVSRYAIDACDFLKIDVEGFEQVALAQLGGLIERCRPYLIFEYRKQHWAKFDAALGAVLRQLQEFGYRLSYIRKNRVRPLVDEVPDSCELLCEPESRPGPA